MIELRNIEEAILEKTGLKANDVIIKKRESTAIEIIRDILSRCRADPYTIHFASEEIKNDYEIKSGGIK